MSSPLIDMDSLMNIGGLVHGDKGPYPMTGDSLFFTTKLYHIDGFVVLSHTRKILVEIPHFFNAKEYTYLTLQFRFSLPKMNKVCIL